MHGKEIIETRLYDLRAFLKVVFDLWYLMYGKESIETRLYDLRAFLKVFHSSCVVKFDKDIKY